MNKREIDALVKTLRRRHDADMSAAAEAVLKLWKQHEADEAKVQAAEAYVKEAKAEVVTLQKERNAEVRDYKRRLGILTKAMSAATKAMEAASDKANSMEVGQ